MAEEFKNQLGDQAPGIMGMMVQAGGYKDVGELSKQMKLGKVGLPELQKFIALLEQRAKESGAYQAGINSMAAAQTRMNNQFVLFSSSFMKFFDDTLKGVFASTADSLKGLTEYFDNKTRIQEQYGIVAGETVVVDTLLEIASVMKELLSLSYESWNAFLSKLGMGLGTGTVEDWLADRQMKRAYFKDRGVTTEAQKEAYRQQGYPGILDYANKKYLSLGSTTANANMQTYNLASRLGIDQDKNQTAMARHILNFLVGTNTMTSLVGNAGYSHVQKQPWTPMGTTNSQIYLSPTFHFHEAKTSASIMNDVDNYLKNVLTGVR